MRINITATAILSIAFAGNLIATEASFLPKGVSKATVGSGSQGHKDTTINFFNRAEEDNGALNKLRSSERALSVSGGDSGYPGFIAPTIFGAYGAILIFLLYELRNANYPFTFGNKALAFVTGAVSWDNLVISLGSVFFKDARFDPVKYGMLKVLSYPRFIFHAVGVPFLLATTAEIGRAAGVKFLDNDLLQLALVAVALTVAVTDRLTFTRSTGIDLDRFEDSPPKSLERDLTWFTYKVPSFSYVIPSIIVSLVNLAVGVAARGTNESVGNWLIVSAVAVIVGSALPGYIMRFTGNAGEVAMLVCYVKAASLAYTK